MGITRELNYPEYVFGGDSSVWDDINETAKRPDFQTAYDMGWKFDIARASFGLYKDTDFDANWEAKNGTPLLQSAYHFLVWDQSPERQAEFFWGVIKDKIGLAPVFCDFEWWSTIPANAFDILYRFLERLKQLTSNRIGIYTAKGFWDQYGKKDDYWKQYLLWLAHWSTLPPLNTSVPVPWDNADFWQYSGHGDGLYYGMESKDVDLDYYMGSLQQLQALFGKDIENMYDNSARSLYIDSNRVVTNWDALAKDVDFVCLRAAYVPHTPFGTGKYFNYDTATTKYMYVASDSSYIANFKEAKKRGLKVVTVLEVNPAFDKDVNYDRQDQVAHYNEILKGTGENFVGDAIMLQIMVTQWIENSRVTIITANNFSKCIENLFPAMYAKFGKTIYGWSTRNVFKDNGTVYNYMTATRDAFFDVVNRGEAKFPFGFTYQAAPGWSSHLLASVASLQDSINFIPALTANELNNNVRIGSYTGYGSEAAPNIKVHGFLSVVGTKLPYLTGFAEPLVFDIDKVTFFKWMDWNTVVDVPDTIPPTVPQNLQDTGDFEDVNINLTWDASTDVVGVVGYNIYRNGSRITTVTSTSFVDMNLPSGDYDYAVTALDKAGNESGKSNLVRVGILIVDETDDLESRVTALEDEMDALKDLLRSWLG